MKLSSICFLILLSISACSQAEKPVEIESKGVAIPDWKLPGVDAENERYWFCNNIDTAFQHPLAVKTLNLEDSIGSNEAKRIIKGLHEFKNMNSLWIWQQHNLNLEPFFEVLQSSDSLQEIMLTDCRFRLSGKIRKLKHLKKLVIRESGICEVPIDFLNSLNLEKFEIKDYDNSFHFTGKLKPNNSLQDLWILGCSEKKLNNELYELTNLKRLSIYNSALTSISSNIVRLKKLEELMIADCPLSKDENALTDLRSQLHGKCAVKTEKDIPLPD